MQTSFKIPFKFTGDPVASARVQGVEVERCVLDTGAANTVMRLPSDEKRFYFNVNSSGFAHIESCKVENIEFGPIHARIKYADGLKAPEIYLGSEEMKKYCVTFDYKESVAEFTQHPLLHEFIDVSSLGFSHGRPIVSIQLGGSLKQFVLDSGSNGNWLFFHTQTEDLLEQGRTQDKNDVAECGLGNIVIQKEFVHPCLELGGKTIKSMAFNLADQFSFGGHANTLEDGIIGTGYFESSLYRVHTFDFISMKYRMA